MNDLAPGPPGDDPPQPSHSADDPGHGSRTWGKVSALFSEALELPPAEREALLAKLAQADPALAGEIRSLLAAHEASSGFLATPPAAPFLETASPGDRLGPYKIIEVIGRGGMGVVYRAARDDESYRKEVAIKLIDPGMRSDEILKRFCAERQILAMLDHPHIARLIDGGTAPDGSPYLVMDYVPGKPLLEYCDEQRLSVDARLELFLTVCDAVQYAHQRLVVHRDLKSDNILVTSDGSPRLLDFGIAKLLLPDGNAAAVTITAPMNRMLTPDYASPEQVRGDPVTVAGDVYSLGVILYELLAGSRPLRFTTRTPEEVLRVVTQEEPVSPSTAVARSLTGEAATHRGETPQRLRRRLTGDLDYVVLKSLEKSTTRRYGSVDQLAQDVRRHLDGLPVLARGQSTTYRVSRFVRRHRAAVITTSLVVLALVAGLAGTTWQAGVASRERDRANRRFNDVRALAHAVVFDIHDAIATLPGSTKARETLVQHALRYLDNLSGEASGDLSLQHELGMAYGKIGDVQGRPMFPNLGRTSQALQSYQKSLALLQGVARAWPDSLNASRDVVVTSQRLSDLLNVMGRPDEAMKLAMDAKQQIEFELTRHPNDAELRLDLGTTCDRLCDMKYAAGDTVGADAECAAGLKAIEQLFHDDPRDPTSRRAALIGYTKQAGFQDVRGDHKKALTTYHRAEALALEAVAALPNNTDASRDLSIVLGTIGLVLADGGEIDSALAYYGRGMTIAETLAAADAKNVLQQADLAAGHYDLGSILVQGKRFAEAEQRYREAFDRYARIAAADTANAQSRSFTARSARRAGEACRALSKQAPSLAERSRARARALSWLGRSRDMYIALK